MRGRGFGRLTGCVVLRHAAGVLESKGRASTTLVAARVHGTGEQARPSRRPGGLRDGRQRIRAVAWRGLPRGQGCRVVEYGEGVGRARGERCESVCRCAGGATANSRSSSCCDARATPSAWLRGMARSSACAHSAIGKGVQLVHSRGEAPPAAAHACMPIQRRPSARGPRDWDRAARVAGVARCGGVRRGALGALQLWLVPRARGSVGRRRRT